MKNALKRSLSVILSMLLIFTIIPMGTVNVLAATVVSDLGIELGTDVGITRAEWLHNLVVVFNMAVEDDALPDNYFSDLTEEHEYYSDIILAVEFGIVDIEAGEELCPDDYVTRDFAASTLNFCLGYQLEEGTEYTFTDYESCSSPDSAQIAVDRGWLKLSGGCFEPTTLVTSAETETMFNDAANVLEEAVVDTEYDSTYDFADDVIVVEKGTVVSEDENGVVSITDCPETISVGDKFAVYHEEIPCVYVAETVTFENGVTKIATSIVEAEEAYTDVDAQGEVDMDIMEIIPAEGMEFSVTEEDSGVSPYSSRSTKKLKTINIPLNHKIADGVSLTGKVKIKNPLVEYSVDSSGYAYVALNGNTEINYGIKADFLSGSGISKTLTLFTCNVAGIGSFDVSIVLDFSGSATGTVKGVLVAGIECEKGGNIRAIKNFTQTEQYANVEARAKIGLCASLGVTKMPVISAKIYAEMGVTSGFKSTTYNDGKKPGNCVHYSGHLYAEYGARASVDFGGVWKKSFDKTYNIYTASNSPVRIVHHYEDGVVVPSCTRGTENNKYYTSGSSRWSGCGWSSADGAYALNSDGTKFALYDYTLDENNQATITAYNGNSWSVYIPSTIDGYTVVAIGDNAFQYKTVANVVIPDTVTNIGNSVFWECENLKSIIIPESVVSLGTWVFYNCISLTDITLPNSLKTIPASTFNCCASLTSINIPNSVTTIEDYAFYNCISLKYVILSKSLISLDYGAFGQTAIEEIEIPKSLDYCSINYNSCYEFNGKEYYVPIGPFVLCENLKTVKFEEGTTQIADSLFAGCVGLEEVVIPDTVTTIENYAFSQCLRLKSVKMGNAVTKIDTFAFNGCVSLTEIDIPDSVTEIGDSCFDECVSLKNITLSKNLSKLGEHAFKETIIEEVEIPKTLDFCDVWSVNYTSNGESCSITGGPFALCRNLKTVMFEKETTQIANGLFAGCVGLEKIVIPNTVTRIENDAFRDCVRLKEVTLSNSLTEIEYQAFDGCISLTKIDIPNSVTKIGESCFEGCVSLIGIDIPDSVIEIGNSCFEGCILLKNVTLSKNLSKLGSYVFTETIIEKIEIPKKLDLCYQGASSYDYNGDSCSIVCGPFALCDNLKTVTFEEGTTQIANDLFAGCVGLEEIVIPDTVTTIEYDAFRDCVRLKEVTLPNSLTEIEYQAFDGCVSLTDINIPDSVTQMGSNCFDDCSVLESVKLSASLEIIPSYMFRNCISLKSIDIPSTVKTIQPFAFYGCIGLEDFTFSYGTNLKEIQWNAFYGCSSLKEANLPETLEIIDSNAFQNCVALEKVNIPKYVESIGTQAFMGCEVLATVDFADYSIQEIKTDTFKDCSRLTKIVLPKGLTKIGSQAFMNDTSLTEVVIPESVTSIDSTAFSYPAKTTIYGKTSSYAETFATEGGFKFSENSIPVEGIILKDGVENITLDVGETYRAEFEVYPEDANDVITLAADNTNVTVTGHDIYARYTGDTLITATATSGLTYEFNVHIRRANSISITKQPTKLSYLMGESLDLSGMKVQVQYNDGSVKNVTDYTVSGFDSSVEGTSSVTVQWIAANGSKYTTTFAVEIIDPTPKVTGIFIETLPIKVQYELREKLDLTGIVVKANYTDGSVKEITDYTTSGFNALKNAAQVITVTYNGFTTTFTVFVGDVPTEHNYGDWVIDKEATCTESGSRHKTCSLCGDVVTETIAATGHNYSTNWTIDKKATCTEKGSKSHHCLNCDSKTDVTVIFAIGHIASSWKTDTKATVYKAGSKHKECTECGEVLETATIKQLKCSKPKIKTIANTQSGVKITWSKVSGADKYYVYRKTSGGSYKKIGTTSKTYYTDKKATSGKKYYYVVKAVNEAGSSDSSKSLSKLYLADPTLKTLSSTKKGIVLKWNKITGAQGYMVYRKTGSSSYKKIATVKGSSKVTYTDKSAKKGKKYTYKVKAYYSKTYSAYSNTKKITDKY